MAYWLMKSEPDVFSFDDLQAKTTHNEPEEWGGVRNYAARNNMRAMALGDEAFFYHSNIGREIVGIVEIVEAHMTDPTDDTGKWAAVRVKPKTKLPSVVTLKQVKAEPQLADMQLVKLSRLSMAEVMPDEWSIILEMAGV